MAKIASFGKFFAAVLLGLGAFLSPAHAQLKTGNSYVTAIIDPNNQGLITIRIAPGTSLDPILSYPQKSFVSIMVNDKIFTNNHTGGHISDDPRFGGFLDNGISRKIADTVQTTWTNKNGCDIIQEVYPVQLEASGQIVMRWKVRNNSPNTPVWGQAQFLLDLQVGAQNPNDGAPVLTRYGYRPIWEQYNSGSTFGIPWFFSAFENQLPNPPTFNTGITGVGYNQDVNYKLGLKKPAVMTVGDWNSELGVSALVDFLWGVSGAAPWGAPYSDAAVLYQWDGMGVAGGKTAELARTSYGTGEFGICTGQLFGIVFYPRYFRWASTKYEPDPANVEFYAFDVYSPLTQDPNYGPPSSGTHLKLHVGPNLHIVEPDTAINAAKTIQRQQTDPVGYIPQYGVGTAFWQIVADKAVNCNNQVLSWLKFTAESSLGGTGPIFFNSGDGDTCEHAVRIDCVQEDHEAPFVDDKGGTTSFPFAKSFEVHDDRPKDRGLDKITWMAQPGSGTDTSKFKVELPTFPPCSKLKHIVKVTQLDSTIGGCLDFTFVDCVGNDTLYTVCFPAHPLIPTPDTLPPVITTVEHTPGYPGAAPCNGRCDSILITDNRQYDSGLESIVVLNANNMSITALNPPFGAPSHRAKICVIDSMLDGSITIRVRDTADNYTDSTYSYCTVPDTIAPIVSILSDQVRRGHWMVTVTDTFPWDRLIDTIRVVSAVNVTINPPYGITPYAKGSPLSSFEVVIQDSTKDASFCIDAKDLWSASANWSVKACANVKPDSDRMCPNIVSTPPLGPNVTSISVAVDDYHTNAQGDTLGWDKGIDAIWFTGVRGILVPAPMKIGCKMTAPPFTLTVEDTLNIDSIACATVNALDCAGNVCQFTWCYPYNPDDLPPLVRVWYNDRSQLGFSVADSQLYDRGLKQVTLKNDDNFSTVDLIVNRDYVLQNDINRPKYSSSSFGTLEAVDYWGSLNVPPAVKDLHTASIDLGVWVQDVQMKKGELVRSSGTFELPIRFVANDTFSLERKGIDEFSFTFTLSGAVGAVNNFRVKTTGTATDGWIIDPPVINGNTYTIHGTKPVAGRSLAGMPGDTFLTLQFDAVKNEFTKDVILTIDQVNGETILYNNGADRIVTGKNAIATLPAPYGTLSGSHIVIVGTCAPSLETGSQPPSIVSLEQNSPNPFNGLTTFTFTIKEDGMVKLAIYDMLGKQVEQVVNAILARGRYTVSFDGSHYGTGSYIARLQANGAIRSRMMRLER